ncbi:KDO2-lipid IV(A) lauroyltransferase [Tenacibaculum mesophilum]|uniref:Lipid A biosynthesis acyltransferase n=1 Tax=Tenacibaculum mesophilum TaxID=104268 RepID=A0ABN5T4G5_9FLAO|nr:lysophospholipid acyltransferase family protein [Tenacibaculum mesophilum]AZJ31235.1 lipid A biosynthesis acyltransferase [Tenacibaculum mesophilum]QFS29282.1 lipid A biosynthesis acyltransferase [Tenacibaculum mesophilum]SHF49483.1 KDO2-lipid IV(A) lauroyltransferase [Tenacibaculum mesophilum]
MKLFLFIIVYPLIWMLSILPMRLLYIISDFFRLIIFNLIGYRKKVVVENLKKVFPDKSDKEIKNIARKFYKHFVDLIFESIKSFTISKKEIHKRYKYKNPELVNKLTKEGKSIALVGAHQANWEWSFGLPLVLNGEVFGAYTRLANKYFEKAVKTSRTKFGIIGLKTSETVKGIHKNYKNKTQGIYILLSDQSPQIHKTHYWAKFLGIKVPVHTGAEILSKKYNFAVVNYVAKKVKRGYFEVEFELITENPKDFENYQITDKYLEITEKNIKAQPEFYLWTHKRFKHKDKYAQWLENRKASQ